MVQFSAWYQQHYEIRIQKGDGRLIYPIYDKNGYIETIVITAASDAIKNHGANRKTELPMRIVSRKSPLSEESKKDWRSLPRTRMPSRTSIMRDKMIERLKKPGDKFAIAKDHRKIVYNIMRKINDFQICVKQNSKGRLYVHRLN